MTHALASSKEKKSVEGGAAGFFSLAVTHALASSKEKKRGTIGGPVVKFIYTWEGYAGNQSNFFTRILRDYTRSPFGINIRVKR